MCPRCRLQFIPDEPPIAEPSAIGADMAAGAAEAQTAAPAGTPPGERLALRMPWRQQISLPDEGELILGRSSAEFRGHPDAAAAHQVSREHARFFRDEHGDLWVEDRDSANGTYIDGVPLTGSPSRLRSGQILRLAQDVECPVLRLDEYGEPVGGNDHDERQS
jgi:FHA domain